MLLERELKSLNMHLIFRLMLVLKFLNIKVHRFWLELLCQAVLLQVKALCVCVFFSNFIKSPFILFYYDCYYYVLSYFNFNLKKKKLWGAF